MSAERPIAEGDLHAYIEGALEGTRVAAVEDYLGAHPDVAERIADYAAQRNRLRAALEPVAAEPVPPDLSLANLLAARHQTRIVSWRVAAAAVVCLAVGGGAGWVLRGTSERPANGLAALAREAAITYEVFAPDKARPVEIRAADQEQLVRWVSNRLHRPMKVPDLAGAGYRFIGGRVVATAHGPAGMYMYDDDQGGRVAVLVRPMDGGQTRALVAQDDGPITGFAWIEGGIGYSLVATSPSHVLHTLADEVRRQMSKPG